ncbi:MAG: glycosyl hydrolase [Acidobacteria bacterium]|uniref:Glycosyl hydrolase n=1 Tax=Candidatus Polarisedimenticola svalbardensis TaxID=2886004 RepID=A0A8J7C2P7_9BACT|nr:glycosyl hydrolase [Candidatus Polarisedimenticola svalbardensis]
MVPMEFTTNNSLTFLRLVVVLISLAIGACSGPGGPEPRMVEVLQTSESGHKMASVEPVPFQAGSADGTVIAIYPERLKQTIDGIGSSFTESSAFVLAHLEPERRREVMEQIYGEAGANFTLTRTHIGSCDFSVEGKYSYADKPDDKDLTAFSIAPDQAGFDPADYPGIQDASYDLLPMIQEALEIKQGQKESELRIIASAWTAPPWMKTIGTWYVPGSTENNWQGDGGWLKPEYVSTYADYLLRYLEAYGSAGVPIWGLTPVNEPHGNGGNWESMHFSPESQNDFVKNHLGPRLAESDHSDARLLIYDQNRDGLEEWADAILSDPDSAKQVYGAAVHWYSSTFKVFEDSFERVHEKYPDCSIIHTEGCIDSLGVDAPAGIEDPARFKEAGWFKNDAFWWNANATDWAYSATWAGEAVADHPVYTPVHRYARNIIVSLDHWVGGWVDWNVVLDRDGGPNHVGNFCGAPIMIDTATQEVYYTPIYYVLAQFSRTIRPGDQAVRTERTLAGLDPDALHASATINNDRLLSVQLLNTTKEDIAFKLQVADSYADVTIPANSVQTVRVQL